MRRRILLFFAGVCAAFFFGASPASAAIPDLYSGSWPAQLMPSKEALGTITWVPVSADWGFGVLNEPWGGAPFTNCPARGQTRFFLGRYGTGGKLIACTIDAAGTELHGRYDGAGGEFRPGSFDVKIIRENPRIFFGVYVEDGGITTDWCGQLIPDTAPDLVPPTVRALASAGRAGHVVPLRFSASDDRGLVRVRLTVMRAGKLVGSVFSPLRRFGAQASLPWRPRKRLRGTFTYCARAWDRFGNASAKSCSTVRIH